MATKAEIRLITTQSPGDLATATTLWAHLNVPLVAPNKVDWVERAQKPFSSGPTFASELYRTRSALFVKGKGDRFELSIQPCGEHFTIWSMWIDVGGMAGKNGPRWREWLFDLCGALPILFGSVCSDDEFEAKHLRIAGAGPRGISGDEFYDYLPGLYWMTLFGPELTKAFGPKLPNLGGTAYFRLEAGQSALVLDSDIETTDMEVRLAEERGIVELLGRAHFFDSEQPKAKYKQVPQLMKRLA